MSKKYKVVAWHSNLQWTSEIIRRFQRTAYRSNPRTCFAIMQWKLCVQHLLAVLLSLLCSTHLPRSPVWPSTTKFTTILKKHITLCQANCLGFCVKTRMKPPIIVSLSIKHVVLTPFFIFRFGFCLPRHPENEVKFWPILLPLIFNVPLRHRAAQLLVTASSWRRRNHRNF